MSHNHDVFTGLVIFIAVGEDCIEVFDAFFGGNVVIMFKSLFYGSKIHGMFDDLVVVGNVELDGINGATKRPSKLVFPNGLHHHIS